ncbi:hypothetical protein BDK51DRAFT_34434 [Blyttiomyces helicus]|uniref:Uncharacterized protein n=1 Tax=Blyttiomyces helicus TaxID=388810 RepID=A0A4P9WQ03_9FUNG|nr:hypothetical protein BDK51DRAFT_34434 [Blyttiomyces helicus]|eukprot:RKO94435.1 hypothetical protein BDK51DRAFT_34434 [Blyttiomyces helicus]
MHTFCSKRTMVGSSPALGGRSSGTKLLLHGTKLPINADVAIGISDETSLWYGISSASVKVSHRWFAGEENIMSLNGIGDLTLNGNNNRVLFAGLSNNGVELQSANGNPVMLKFGDMWSLSTTPNNSAKTDSMWSQDSLLSADPMFQLCASSGVFEMRMKETFEMTSTSGNVMTTSSLQVGHDFTRFSDYIPDIEKTKQEVFQLSWLMAETGVKRQLFPQHKREGSVKFSQGKANSSTTVRIGSFLTFKKPSFSDEGHSINPNGKESGFTFQWKMVYGTNKSSTMSSRLGNIISDGTLSVTGKTLFHDDVSFANDSTLKSNNIRSISNASPLNITAEADIMISSNASEAISVSEKNIVFYRSLLPSIGEEFSIDGIKVQGDICTKSLTVTEQGIIDSLQIRRDGNVRGHLSIDGIVKIKTGLVVCGEITSTSALTIRSSSGGICLFGSDSEAIRFGEGNININASCTTITGTTTITDFLNIHKSILCHENITVDGSLVLAGKQVIIPESWVENTYFYLDDCNSLNFCLPGDYNGCGPLQVTGEILADKITGNIANFHNLKLGNAEGKVSPSTLTIVREQQDIYNFILTDQCKNVHAGFMAFEMGLGTAYVSGMIKTSSGVQIENSEDVAGELIFRNDTNISVIKLNQSKDVCGSNLLSISNKGGDVAICSAGGNGIQLNAISGNAHLSGSMTIQCGLDVSTSKTTDAVNGALNVNGGGVFGGSVYLKKAIIFENVNKHCVSIVASEETEERFQLTLPNDPPSLPEQYLVSDQNGRLSWKPCQESDTQRLVGKIKCLISSNTIT